MSQDSENRDKIPSKAASGDSRGDRGEVSRRDFIRKSALLGVGGVAAGMASSSGLRAAPNPPPDATAKAPDVGTTSVPGASAPPQGGPIPMRDFGKIGVKVSAIGVGGFHIGAAKTEDEGIRIIHEAIDAGINFMDNAWDYHNGRSEEVMGKALASDGRRDKVFLMTKVCTHGRDAKVGMQQLEDSLRRLKTDHLDLWQIHECVYYNDPERHFAAGGVYEALLKAKEQGKVRFLGFTGHKDPAIHAEMLKKDFSWDACQLPLNAFDSTFRSFETHILPELNKRGIAPIGMKSLGGTGEMIKKSAVTHEEALRYAMSLPVAVTVSGMNSLDVLHQNLKIAQNFRKMDDRAMASLRERVAPMASDGRFELYKVTARFEGDEGRAQHAFPLSKPMAM